MFQKPRTRQEAATSTSSRAPSTNICSFSRAYPTQDAKQKLDNPVWHIHSGTPADRRSCRSRSVCCSTSSRSRTPKTRTCCGASSAATRRTRRRRATRPRQARRLCDPLLPRLREADEEVPRADAKKRSARRRSTRCLRSRRRTQRPKSCRTIVYRSRQMPTATPRRRCAPGSRRSTRCCSARAKARASARSSRSTASRNTRLIAEGSGQRLTLRRRRLRNGARFLHRPDCP